MRKVLAVGRKEFRQIARDRRSLERLYVARGHAVRPVVDKVFPFESTNEALAYVETGRAKGKVVIKVK